MFRKLQLKFFGIITSILLAIFIGVLGSINILMDTVMEHQTKVVLEQVASGVEYDSNIKTFTFQPLNDSFKADSNEPPLKPDSQRTEPPRTTKASTAAATSTTTSAAKEATSTTAAPETEAEISPAPAPEAQAPAQTESPAPVEEPAEPEPPAPVEEVPTVTAPPIEKPTEKPTEKRNDDKRHNEEPTQPSENNGWNGPYPPWGPWQPCQPWQPWQPRIQNNNTKKEPAAETTTADQNHHESDREDDCRQNEEGIKPQANTMQIPVLDGYTVLDSDESSEPASTTTASDSGKTSDTAPVPRGNMPPNGGDPVPKSLGSIDFFIIMADKDGKYLDIRNSDMTEEVAQQYIDKILDSNATCGMVNNYQFCTEKKPNGTLLVLTDKSAEMNMMKKLKRITVIVGSISVVILSALGYFLSGLIVKPISVAFDKQKQFISDASHELKTPLTVISANADVLAGEIGENRWLTYIRDQTDRMNVLVNDLLNLTRLENRSNEFIQAEFDLSKAITNTALPFECQAFETNKNFELDIDDGIRTTGSEQHIKQMAAIFIDNALKYSSDGGTVRVSLKTENGKPVLSVYNTGKGVKDSEKDKIFERFYRSDASRNRATGGYGLGLAIAKSIIDKHKFKVSVDNIEGKSICFIVTM